MSKQHFDLEIESLSEKTLLPLTVMSLELWPDCNFEEELSRWEQISKRADNFCALAKSNSGYAGFIHISIRNDYVEGSDSDKTGYLEGIFVKPEYRNKGIGRFLLTHGEQWVKSMGLKQLASDTDIDNSVSQQFHKEAGFEEMIRIVCFLKNI